MVNQIDEAEWATAIRARFRPFVEHTTEATAACLVAMVQGNLLTLTLGHWLIASKTGILAGGLTAILILVSRVSRPWLISGALGLITFGVDYWVHPGMFGPFFAEALVTGAMAAVLSIGVHLSLRGFRALRAARRTPSA